MLFEGEKNKKKLIAKFITSKFVGKDFDKFGN